MTRRQRKLDDIILTLAAYSFMSTQFRRDTVLKGLKLQIEEYIKWAA